MATTQLTSRVGTTHIALVLFPSKVSLDLMNGSIQNRIIPVAGRSYAGPRSSDVLFPRRY